ncbi:MAG: transporter [Acidobacteria bacterium]|nr:MAG: transporter [Acidobacteriota bacterium]
MIVVGVFLSSSRAQDLAPRAYLITPLHANAVTLNWSFSNGSIDLNGLPVGVTGTYSVPIFNYYHSFGLFGRSANVLAVLPYAAGNFEGTQPGAEAHLYRSGLLDSGYRFSVNLKGGPAMPMQEFMKWKQKVLLGVSLRVVAPTGQYDPTKLINWGTNRWAFKPEIGYSQRWGHWILDGYMGGWFFTTNNEFFSHNSLFPGTRTQSQSPIGVCEGHLSYDFKPLLWASLDGNFWFGGKTSVNGVENPLSQLSNSRLGATGAVPITKHQSLKFSYSTGTYIRYGGNFQTVSFAWQYSWLGKPN